MKQVIDQFNTFVNGPYTLTQVPVTDTLIMVFVNGLLQAYPYDYGVDGQLVSIAGLDVDPNNAPFIQIVYWVVS